MTNTVNVWDPLVRIIHWSLLVLFCISYISGEEEHWIHIYSGYSILSLITIRIIWGFIGSKHARFKDFIYPPKSVIAYLQGLRQGNAKHYRGHNPAGGMMILALLATLFITTFSGMKLYGLEEGEGPFAVVKTTQQTHDNKSHSSAKAVKSDDQHHSQYDSHHDQEEFWEEIHEAAVKFMLLLIILHVLGVIISSRYHAENLVKSMIHGKKK